MNMMQQIKQIDSLREKESLNGANFEQLVHEGLSTELPFCVLGNVALFRPDQFRTEDDTVEGEKRVNSRAYEIDNLFHYRRNEVDTIVIVEAKLPKITLDGDVWRYFRKDKATGKKSPRDAREQLVSHSETILRYLRPLGRNVEMKVHALLVCGDPNTPIVKSQFFGTITLQMCSYRALPGVIEAMKSASGNNEESPQFLRIAQSEYMTLLRLGIPLNTLGHPELRNAIPYINRCKRDIDHELYKIFAPSKSHWVINGTAGMGKSVLLAYSTSVFACDHNLKTEEDGCITLASFKPRSNELGLKPKTQRNICVFAMKPKQKSVLESLYATFVRHLMDEDFNDELNFLKPRFDVWMDEKGVPNGCNILVIDESHDLTDVGQEIVREWHKSSEEHYLLLACDRHQKIRLSDSKATIIKGLSFQGHSKFLRRNYRNPFSVYAAAVGLMFRWFSNDGVKVIPTEKEFKDLLGFEASATSDSNQLSVRLKDDSHPANLWSHNVGRFRSCSAIYTHLVQQNLASSEVLWVRFSKEDPDFNYEQLHCFTYHNFCSSESSALVDKYVKGQEFSIVVIEGFPDYMDDGSLSAREGGAITKEERRMWSFRRQVYICASRATAFLYFVCDVSETENVKSIKSELDRLISALSLSTDPTESGSKEWRFTVQKTAVSRKIAVFDDMQENVGADESKQMLGAPSIESPQAVKTTPLLEQGANPGVTEIAQSKDKTLFELLEENAMDSKVDRASASNDRSVSVHHSVKKNSAIEKPRKQSGAQTLSSPQPTFKDPSQPISTPVRTRITVEHPVVMADLAKALGRTLQNAISNFNSIGGFAKAKTILSENEAQELAKMFNTELEFSNEP